MKSSLDEHFLHLASSGDVALHEAGAVFWQRLSRGELSSLDEGRMVTVGECASPWGHWEMHPAGDEVVIALAGAGVLVVERENGEHERLALSEAGDYAVVPRGAWHTFEPDGHCRLMFLTPGKGTQHRPLAT